MKKITMLVSGLCMLGMTTLVGQNRYVNEVFADSEIAVVADQVYGANWNPYLNPAMVGGQTQVQPLQFDAYFPAPTVDTVTNRPVVIYFHTGSFLPPSVTNGCTGTRTDSAAVRICRKLARHGFVAISATYRLGWLANSTDLDLRRGTNLLAVYYSIQDAKTLVRYLNLTKIGAGNPWGIDPGKIIMLGQGSGGYTTFAYATIDKYNEVAGLPKFQYQGTTGILGQPVSVGDPYVDTARFGDWDGNGGAATIIGQNPIGLPIIDTAQMGRNIINHAGLPDDVLMVINMGGAMGDSSWLEAGDIPMISVHSRFDFFAPYFSGMVQVPVGQQFFPVVDVAGSHTAIRKANAFGNNDIFLNAGYNDFLWTHAINNPYNTGNVPGIYTINIQPTNAQMPWVINSGPWDYWDPASTCVNTGNPNNISQSKAYIDTVMNYILPRMLTVLSDAGLPVGIDENKLASRDLMIFPNPARDAFSIKAKTEGLKLELVEVLDITGKSVYRSGKINETEVLVPANNWPAGIYMVRTHTNMGVSVQKITIQ